MRIPTFQLRFPPRGLAIAYLPVLALLVIAGTQTRVPVDVLTRDANAIAEVPCYVGAISNFGILLWTAAASIALFAWFAARSLDGDRNVSRLLWTSGLLTLLLVFDDMLQLHEEVLPNLVGIPEPAVMAGYLALGLAWLVASFGTIYRSHLLPLLLAVMFFGFSTFLDLVPTNSVPGLWRLQICLVEDGAKLFGVVSWLAYLARVSQLQLRSCLLDNPR